MVPIISRIQRNHGLEHASLNLLGKSHPRGRFAGHSDPGGFWILGEITTSELTEVILEALDKLRAGQHHLAIHRNCGTNMLVSGFAAGLAGAAGLIGAGETGREKLERIPLITTLGVAALILTRPLGPLLQKKITTNGNPGNLEIIEVVRYTIHGSTAHRVRTQG